MRKLTTKKIKKLTCLVLVLTLLVSMLLQSSQVEVKAATTTTWVPITCYTNTTSNVTFESFIFAESVLNNICKLSLSNFDNSGSASLKLKRFTL